MWWIGFLFLSRGCSSSVRHAGIFFTRWFIMKPFYFMQVFIELNIYRLLKNGQGSLELWGEKVERWSGEKQWKMAELQFPTWFSCVHTLRSAGRRCATTPPLVAQMNTVWISHLNLFTCNSFKLKSSARKNKLLYKKNVFCVYFCVKYISLEKKKLSWIQNWLSVHFLRFSYIIDKGLKH